MQLRSTERVFFGIRRLICYLGYVSMMSFIVALAFTRPESGFFLAWRHIWDLKEPYTAIDRSKQRKSSETVHVSLSLSMANVAKECSKNVLGLCVEISSSLGTTGQEHDSLISGAKQITR